MLREGGLLARPYSCWCPTCFDVATAGPGQGARGGQRFLRVEQQELPCQTGSDASSLDLRAQTRGHALAAGLAPQGGQWVLVRRTVTRRASSGWADLFFRWVQRAFFPVL